MKRAHLLCLIALILAVCFPAGAQSLDVIAFNVESGDADPAEIARSLKRLPPAHLWGFSEVEDESWARTFDDALSAAAGRTFERVLGTTGGKDRLLIVYDATHLVLVQHDELHDLNIGGNVRAPLVGHFRFRNGGEEFLFVVNHLYRGSASRRHEQARQLNAWAAAQALPVITGGDFNFDWDLPDGDTRHDLGFDELTRDGVFEWARPATLVKTQCSEQFNSVLDFIFVAGGAQQWNGRSEILFASADYCPDDERKSDHRPVRAQFAVAQPTALAPAPAARDGDTEMDALRRRIEALERELGELRRLIEEQRPE